MKASRALLFAIGFFIASSSVYAAAIQQCDSTDPQHSLAVSIDRDANTITVNGEKRKVHAPKAGAPKEVMLVSDPYSTKQYGDIFIALGKNKDGQTVISQIGAKDNEVKVFFVLECK